MKDDWKIIEVPMDCEAIGNVIPKGFVIVTIGFDTNGRPIRAHCRPADNVEQEVDPKGRAHRLLVDKLVNEAVEQCYTDEKRTPIPAYSGKEFPRWEPNPCRPLPNHPNP